MTGYIGVPQRVWTFEETQQLRDFAERGMNIREIATAMNRSERSILGRAQRMNIKVRMYKHHNPWTIEERDALVDHFDNSLTLADAAQKIGRSPGSAYGCIRRLIGE